MRIGLFTDTYPPYINGVSTSIAMLKKALEKKGHQVFVVAINPEEMSYRYEENGKIIRIPGIPLPLYDYRLSSIYPVRIIKKIRKWNLDVIHSHTEFGVGTFARIIAKQLDIPLVHTYHTMYEDYVHYITKGYFDGPSKKIVEYLTKFYCDKTATELIVPTKKTYDLFKEKYHVDRNIHIVPTGIEIERFYQEKYNNMDTLNLRKRVGLNKEDKVILFVGRLGKEKSVDLLIEAQASIVKKYPKCKLLIIGDGPDMELFHKLVNKHKLEDNVLLIGKVPWEEIPKYYQVADIFATASRTETQGLTVIEAMAASIPVVAADDESFKNIIIDDLNGYLFKNKKEYINKIETLLSDNDKLKRMGKQARISTEPYSTKYFAEKVLAVYKTAIGDKPKDRSFIGRMKRVVKKGFNGK